MATTILNKRALAFAAVLILMLMMTSSLAIATNLDVVPINGTNVENLKINFTTTSPNNTYVIPDINEFILGIYSFEEPSRFVNSYGPGTNFTEAEVNACGKATSEYGDGLFVNNSITASSYPLLNTDGFAISFDLRLNATTEAAVSSSNFLDFFDSDTGFVGHLTNQVNEPDYDGVLHNITLIIFYMYNGSDYDGSTSFRIYDVDMLQSHRILLNLNLKDGYAETWVDGVLSFNDTSITPHGFYVPVPQISLVKTTKLHERYVDELIIINRSLTTIEGINEQVIYSTYNENLTLNYTNFGDYEVNITGFAYNQTNPNITDQYIYSNLKSLTTSISKMYPLVTTAEVGDTTNLFCRSDFTGYYDTITNDNISHIIQYSINSGLNWTNVSTEWQIPEEYAVLGDSNNVYGAYEFDDIHTWIYHFMEYTSIPETNVNQLAIGGKTCVQVLDEMVPAVTNTTDKAFVNCGINALASTNNTYYWEEIYDGLKDKGVENIYMASILPWDVINTENQTYADFLCDKMKDENQWLLSFAADHDDIHLLNLWEEFHDSSGTNITDCGWRKDIAYDRDGVHGTTLAYEYWANGYWDFFDEWVYNTSMYAFEAPSSEEDITYDFRCYSTYADDSINYSITTSYFDMGSILVSLDPTTDSTYEIRESANNMNVTIFAAFGLIALFVVVGAGFLIVKMFSGGMDAGMLMALSIASILLVIVLLAGFYILGSLASVI